MNLISAHEIVGCYNGASNPPTAKFKYLIIRRNVNGIPETAWADNKGGGFSEREDVIFKIPVTAELLLTLQMLFEPIKNGGTDSHFIRSVAVAKFIREHVEAKKS